MSEKEILPFGDPVLRKKSKPVREITPKILRILDDMVDTLYAEEGRAGLAAPQIGILRRLIVMDCGEGLIELIDPEILEMDGEQTGAEACLSFPGYTGIVKRAKYVKIKTLTRTGETVYLEGHDYLARCIQHEIDHLNGILYIDHVEEGQLYLNQSQQKADLMAALKLSWK
ncbi:peptide deformylase [Paenibacillus donghaensis]|uniref:peptide deformylase n=1 Tax=Paenibacillus donghaensis TaxID=414771 RepID=UPI0018835AF5|nr:peptide deformylase [Paenibacillus donghaensis]MBE9913587.1 peptide deformylase [Paenibacillus donghaensis]